MILIHCDGDWAHLEISPDILHRIIGEVPLGRCSDTSQCRGAEAGAGEMRCNVTGRVILIPAVSEPPCTDYGCYIKFDKLLYIGVENLRWHSRNEGGMKVETSEA